MTTARPTDALTDINLDDLVALFGWEARPILAWLLRRLCIGPARAFAQQMLDYDAAVGRSAALAGPSQDLLRTRYVHDLQVEGHAHVPTTGPTLFLANHPGLTDTISVLAAIGRPDLKIIASQRPFLNSLQNIAAHLLFVDGNLGRRVIAAHEIADHLRRGGAALTFPAGRIEPDPDLHANAMDSVNAWADSARVIARMVPEVKVVPVLVRGVLCDRAARHWLTRMKRTAAEREKLSTALQLLAMISRGARPTTVTVRFAPSVDARSPNVHRQVIDRMRQMIAETRSAREAVVVIRTQPQLRDVAKADIQFS